MKKYQRKPINSGELKGCFGAAGARKINFRSHSGNKGRGKPERQSESLPRDGGGEVPV